MRPGVTIEGEPREIVTAFQSYVRESMGLLRTARR